MTEQELMDAALAFAKKSSVSVDSWLATIRLNKNYDYKQAWWYKSLKSVEQAKNLKPAPSPPPPPPPSNSVFAGKGLFTTSDPGKGLGHGADWVASQMDPEGDGFLGNVMWMARPTQQMATLANTMGVPFIAQAENQAELDLALSLHLTVPKALVGNPHSWTQTGFNAAAENKWDLILEWYANAHPWETQPDAANYPRFVNVCFGIYSEGTPGQPGYVAQKPLSEYRAVWHGSFSCWKAEAMTPADWASFAA